MIKIMRLTRDLRLSSTCCLMIDIFHPSPAQRHKGTAPNIVSSGQISLPETPSCSVNSCESLMLSSRTFPPRSRRFSSSAGTHPLDSAPSVRLHRHFPLRSGAPVYQERESRGWRDNVNLAAKFPPSPNGQRTFQMVHIPSVEASLQLNLRPKEEQHLSVPLKQRQQTRSRSFPR